LVPGLAVRFQGADALIKSGYLSGQKCGFCKLDSSSLQLA